MRVAFVILDGMPARHVTSLPVCSRLAAAGAGTVGEAVMTSATYPNHATFITGAMPADHGLVANFVLHKSEIHPAHRVGPQVPTLFDASADGGLRSVFVAGDQHLVGVMAARQATSHWPPEGRIPPSVTRDRYDYASDASVLAAVRAVIADPWDLLVVHLNEPDTAGHIDGPDSPDAFASYQATDAALGQLVSMLEGVWDDLVLIVVSDHDQKMVDLALPPVELGEHEGILIPEGSGAVIWGLHTSSSSRLDSADGVLGYDNIARGIWVLWATPGRTFAIPAAFVHGVLRGHHGGIETRDQVVLVAGGHEAATTLASAVRGTCPPATAWAPTMASLLGLPVTGLPAAASAPLI